MNVKRYSQFGDENEMMPFDDGEYVLYSDYVVLEDLLQDVLYQACSEGNDKADSCALSAYADGLRYLAEHGRFKIKKEYGRRVIGEFIWPKEEGKP